MARGNALTSTISRREEQTRALFGDLEQATTEADRERLVSEIVSLNLPLADALASRYSGRGAETDDLIQAARTALLLAVRRFRSSEGGSFAAYAVPTITGELKRYFRDHCWVVRPPRQVQELRSRVVRAREELEQHVGAGVSMHDLGAHLHVDQRLMEECLAVSASFRPLSLDAGTDEGGGIGSSLSTDEDLASELAERVDLRRALAALSPRDRLVLGWRFTDELTQSEIARRLGVSQMQVSRIIRRILDRTRDLLSPAASLAG